MIFGAVLVGIISISVIIVMALYFTKTSDRESTTLPLELPGLVLKIAFEQSNMSLTASFPVADMSSEYTYTVTFEVAPDRFVTNAPEIQGNVFTSSQLVSFAVDTNVFHAFVTAYPMTKGDNIILVSDPIGLTDSSISPQALASKSFFAGGAHGTQHVS